jgi:hypothetical protein
MNRKALIRHREKIRRATERLGADILSGSPRTPPSPQFAAAIERLMTVLVAMRLQEKGA